MTSYAKPAHGNAFSYRPFIKSNPEEYQKFRQMYKENKVKQEEYQSQKDSDLERLIVRGYN